MSATGTTAIPASIAAWIAARTDPDQAHLLPDSLAEDVRFSFDGRRRTGREEVVGYLREAPGSSLRDREWRVFSDEPGVYTVRFTGPGGAPTPSPGGPLLAIDFLMTLDADGRIATLSPRPHHAEPTDLRTSLNSGDVLPDFTLSDVHGVPVAWRDPAAAAAVVVFTGNGCPWARGWHDRIQDVAREYATRGVRTVQINANDPALSPADSSERSRARVDAGEFAGPYLLDEGQAVARRVGARHTPEVFVVDASAVIAYHGSPDADSEEPDLRAVWIRDALDAVLAGRPPALTDTEPLGCTIKWSL